MQSAYAEHFIEYFVLVFFSSLGVLQLAVTYARLNGLSFFKKPAFNYLLGILAIAGAFAFFYASGDRAAEPLRNIDDGVKRFFGERECLAAFIAGASGALVFTLLISSMAKRSIYGSSKRVTSKGLDVLKEMTFLQAITNRFRRQR